MAIETITIVKVLLGPILSEIMPMMTRAGTVRATLHMASILSCSRVSPVSLMMVVASGAILNQTKNVRKKANQVLCRATMSALPNRSRSPHPILSEPVLAISDLRLNLVRIYYFRDRCLFKRALPSMHYEDRALRVPYEIGAHAAEGHLLKEPRAPPGDDEYVRVLVRGRLGYHLPGVADRKDRVDIEAVFHDPVRGGLALLVPSRMPSSA